jgi:hypothetical protein
MLFTNAASPFHDTLLRCRRRTRDGNTAKFADQRRHVMP